MEERDIRSWRLVRKVGLGSDDQMCGRQMVQRGRDLGRGKGRIQRNQDGAELEQSICNGRKLEVIPQRNTDTIPLLDPQALQSVGHDIAL